MANMSFAKTINQFQNKTKTVTRRLGWKNIKLGVVHTGVEKGQGLKKGEHPVEIGKFIPIDSRWEPLRRMTDDPVYGKAEVILEGFPDMTPDEFVAMFCKMNKCTPDKMVNRIEITYPGIPPAEERR